MYHSRILGPVLLLVASSLLPSCAALSGSIGPQLETVVAARSELETEWNKVGVSLETVEGEVKGFTTESLDPTLFDVQVLAAAFKTAEGQITGGNAGLQEASTTIPLGTALSDALNLADEVTGTEVKALYARGVNILNTLRIDLPNAVEDVIAKAAGSVATAAQAKLEAQSVLEFAERNPLEGQEKLAILRSDYAKLEQEMATLEGVAGTVTSEVAGYSTRFKNLLTMVETRLK